MIMTITNMHTPSAHDMAVLECNIGLRVNNMRVIMTMVTITAIAIFSMTSIITLKTITIASIKTTYIANNICILIIGLLIIPMLLPGLAY